MNHDATANGRSESDGKPPECHREWVLKWLEQFERHLVQYASRLARGNREIAVDAVQHTFLRLCDQSPAAVGDRLPGWLYRVCRNKVIDELRLKSRAEECPMQFDDRSAAGEQGPMEQAEAAELNAHLRHMLDQLPDAQREAIDLWCRGFDYREIAEITGKSYGNVRVIVHRGLEQLRRNPRVQRWLSDSHRIQHATV